MQCFNREKPNWLAAQPCFHIPLEALHDVAGTTHDNTSFNHGPVLHKLSKELFQHYDGTMLPRNCTRMDDAHAPNDINVLDRIYGIWDICQWYVPYAIFQSLLSSCFSRCFQGLSFHDVDAQVKAAWRDRSRDQTYSLC